MSARYYSINWATEQDVIVAVRGDDDNKTIDVPTRDPDFPAINIVPDPEKHQGVLRLHFALWAKGGNTVICRVSEDGTVAVWVEEGLL